MRNTGEYGGKDVVSECTAKRWLLPNKTIAGAASRQRYGSNDLDFTRLADAARNKLLLWGMNRTQIQSWNNRPGTEYRPMPGPHGGWCGLNAGSGRRPAAEGSPVLRLADLRTLWWGRSCTSATYRFKSNQKGFGGTASLPGPGCCAGKIEFINPNLETTSKIVLVRVEIPNPGGEYKPGMQAWITLRSKAHQTVAVTSSTAPGQRRRCCMEGCKNASGAVLKTGCYVPEQAIAILPGSHMV
ncbi:MAG: efflux RND transporter periplasmic adaptor subunit [Saprospirales bacterium]|nr:efflux RND transporter periplasmic adaptor subunit [Saprospirales bacterium]